MAGSNRKRIQDADSITATVNAVRTAQRQAPLTLADGRKSVAIENRAAWEAREVMDIRQAAEYLGISSDSLYKYASENVVPAFKLGNRWRFKRSLLDGWMEQQSSLSLVSTDEKPVKPKQKKPVSRIH